jgi:hypothetical protein
MKADAEKAKVAIADLLRDRARELNLNRLESEARKWSSWRWS